MQKLLSTFLIFLAFLNCSYVKADEASPPVLPFLSSVTAVPRDTSISTQSAAIRAIKVNSDSSETIATVDSNHNARLQNYNENVLLLESVLFYNSSLHGSASYIGTYSVVSERFDPRLYSIIASIKPLNHGNSNDINHFLQINFKTEYIPSEMFNELNSHLAKPIYMSEVVGWAYEAIATGDINVLRVLLDNYNFLFTIQNNEGYGLLSYAILHGSNDIVYMLIYRGANLSEENKYKAQPINIAARTNNIEAVKILLDNGGDINHQDGFGKTSMDYASMNNNKEMYNYLLSFKRA